MKKKFVLSMRLVLVLGLSLSSATSALGNDEHHADKAAQSQTAGASASDSHEQKDHMMDMGKMHEMMKECMGNHKDGKMCEHDMMSQCQKQMKKHDCQKMMKKMKSK